MSSGRTNGALLLGIDIGGTFTDIVAYDQSQGRSYNYKELTTPDDPTRGVISGITSLFEAQRLSFGAVSQVVHATTLFTNALIERRGARTGLITTAGFRDTLEIAREIKYDLYDIFIELPMPLVARNLRREVRERLAPDGTVEIPLDENGLLNEVKALVQEDVASIATVFLHSYANPSHEKRAKALIEKSFPGISVSTSCEVSPEIREYERSSTTTANAYVKPLAAQYISRLQEQLRALGLEARLSMMLSSGGLTHVAEAQERPVQLLESGPAAGALAAAYFGTQSGAASVLAFDMGGTTAKLSVVDDGTPLVAHRFEAAREKRFAEGSGLPISISTIDLIEIGAGGGSIAAVDAMGLLKVGPDSAASVPGPACFGRGGTRPTVTDANLVLGYLDRDSFAGGKIPISLEGAQSALDSLTKDAGLSREDLAWGIHNIVNERMANAARVHMAERGRNATRYSLLTTGGGGPLHGCAVAQKLGIREVICPRGAGVASAIGLLMAPARIDRVASVGQPLVKIDWVELERRFGDLEREAIDIIRQSGSADTPIDIVRLGDLRCVGQGFEVVTELPPGPYRAGDETRIAEIFAREYQSLYFRDPPQRGIEFINMRLSAIARTAARPLVGSERQTDSAPAERRRQVYFNGTGYLSVPVLDRRTLGAQQTITGPAVVEEPESTLIIPPEAVARVEPNGTIIVRLGVAAGQGAGGRG